MTSAALAERRRVRVAVIDSGVNARHPHVECVAGGVGLYGSNVDEDFVDFLGHGTAVAAAIREKASDADIFAVKVFDRQLATSGNVLLRALDWCLDEAMDFVNLSLGTQNERYVPEFKIRLERARRLGTKVVAAYEMNEAPAYPGRLPETVGVVQDADCARGEYRQCERDGRVIYAACGYPRAIPGVASERNLQGISFAVANVTGLLAAEAARCCPR